MGRSRGARAPQYAGEPGALYRAGAHRRDDEQDQFDHPARGAAFLLGTPRLRPRVHRGHSVAAYLGVDRLHRRPGPYLRPALVTGPTPIATGRTAEPAAPRSRKGRMSVQATHTRSAAISSSLAFSMR